MMNEMRSHLPDLDAVHSTGITPQNLDEAMQRLGKVFDHHLPMIALKATTGKKLYG